MGDHDGLARGNLIKVPSCMGSKVTEIHYDRMRWRYNRLMCPGLNGVGLFDFWSRRRSKEPVSVPKRYPEEFRRNVLDLVASGRPVARSLPIWVSAIRPSTPGASRSLLTPVSSRA